ncbi:MAG: hypothetical protein JXA25_04050 [Anaerolineales bacterium]|nr:hypothetical protein [Anaerolineales bacterium]
MQSLKYDIIQPLVDEHNIEKLTYSEIAALFLKEENLAQNKPHRLAGWNPRTHEPVVYNAARQHRPFDNRKKSSNETPEKISNCVICKGNTTRVLDLAHLSQGFTFINKNLFPAIWPMDRDEHTDPAPTSEKDDTRNAVGLHFLQWTSSIHDHDWHNMPIGDTSIVMNRLAVLEKQLLTTSTGQMPSTAGYGDPANYAGYVSIIKNGGAQVGGSIAHSHQQVIFSNLMPRRIYENWKFFQGAGISFSEHMQHTNPAELLIREYPTAVLLVPAFMRRPGDMLLLVKDSRKRYLHQLSAEELQDVSRGWSDAIAAFHEFMPALNRPIAFNAITLNGPGAGLHFAFLPFTQETGGFEHMGLFVSQMDPYEVAGMIGDILNE